MPSFIFNNAATATFLDGISCCGKSTVLKELERKRKINIVFNDYFEMLKVCPSFKNKANNQNIDIIYTLNQLRNIQKNVVYKHSIVDRSPLSSIWYNIIYKVIFRTLKWAQYEYNVDEFFMQELDEFLAKKGVKFTDFTDIQMCMYNTMEQYPSIIITTSDIKNVAKSLIIRNTNLDKELATLFKSNFTYEFAKWYVHVQNRFFKVMMDHYQTPFIFEEIACVGELTVDRLLTLHKESKIRYRSSILNLLSFGKYVKKNKSKKV
ncbi:HZV115-like protein [Penaeus vannamei nudivirus]|nr:HZV115-like protein [Penaeus vannamei nucleopolyhedrovirus]